VASRKLPAATLATVQQVVYDSLQYALADPAAALPTMRRYAQEFSDDVLMQHVDLYVNEWTINLGDVGRRALVALAERANAVGITAATPLMVLAD
jgi:1,4-dihydroxy-6-naphthoate synthase